MSKNNDVEFAAKINARVSEKEFCSKAAEFQGKLVALVGDDGEVLTSVTVPSPAYLSEKKQYSGTLRSGLYRAKKAAGLVAGAPGAPRKEGTARGAKWGYVEIGENGAEATFFGRDADTGEFKACGSMQITSTGLAFDTQAIKYGWASKVLSGRIANMIELVDGKPVGKSTEYSVDQETWFADREAAIESVTDMGTLKAILTGKAEIVTREINKSGKLAAFVEELTASGVYAPVTK